MVAGWHRTTSCFGNFNSKVHECAAGKLVLALLNPFPEECCVLIGEDFAKLVNDL